MFVQPIKRPTYRYKPNLYDLVPLNKTTHKNNTRSLMPKVMDDYYEWKSPTISYHIKFQTRQRTIPQPKWMTEPEETPSSSTNRSDPVSRVPVSPVSHPSVATTTSLTPSAVAPSTKTYQRIRMILRIVLVVLLLTAGILGYAVHYSKPKIATTSYLGTVELYDPDGNYAGGVKTVYTLKNYHGGNFEITLPKEHVTFQRSGDQLWIQQADLPNTIWYQGPITLIRWNNDIILEPWGSNNGNHNQNFQEGEAKPYHAHHHTTQ